LELKNKQGTKTQKAKEKKRYWNQITHQFFHFHWPTHEVIKVHNPLPCAIAASLPPIPLYSYIEVPFPISFNKVGQLAQSQSASDLAYRLQNLQDLPRRQRYIAPLEALRCARTIVAVPAWVEGTNF
jgi:hypothetical protein